MANKPEPTATEVAQKQFETLCALLVADKAYETLRSRLYEKISDGSISDKYAAEDRAAIDLGAMRIVPTFFKMIEAGAAASQNTPPRKNEQGEY